MGLSYILYNDLELERYRPIVLVILICFVVVVIPIRKFISIFNLTIQSKLLLMCAFIPVSILTQLFIPDIIKFIFSTPGTVLSILMPIIILQFTYNLDLHTFKKSISQILIISVLRFSMDAVIMGFLIMKIIQPVPTLKDAMAYGFICATSMPITVVIFLEELGRFKYLSVLLQSETIFNATIAYLVCTYLLSEQMSTEPWHTFVIDVIRYFGGGILCGLIHGRTLIWILLKLQNDPMNALVLIVSNIFVSYAIIGNYLRVSGDISALIVGLYIATVRKKFSQEVDKFILSFWESFICLLDEMLFVSCVCYSIMITNTAELVRSLHSMFLIYLSTNIVRFLSFLGMMPILQRLGYGMNASSLIMMSFAGIKDTLNLVYSIRMYEYRFISTFALHTLSLVGFNMLVNTTFMPQFLKVMGLSDISLTRKTNMNSCMRFILDKRSIYISALKLNRYLSDADWATIQKITILKHPYKLNITEDEENFLEYRHNTCPDCQQDFPIQLTKKQKVEMLKEAQSRVLKAKKISYIRQFENGMLAKESISILLHNVELALEATGKSLSPLDILRKLCKKGNIVRFLSKYIIRIWADNEAYLLPPTIYSRRVFYFIVMHFGFDIVIYFNIVVIAIPTIAILAMNEKTFQNIEIAVPLYILFLVSNLIFLLEFIFKILGFSTVKLREGFANYFSSVWNWFDFIVLLFSYVDQTVDSIHIVMIVQGKLGTINSATVKLLRFFRLLRIIRLIRILKGGQPKLLKHFETTIDLKMALAFDIGKGMLVAYEEIEQQLNKMIEDQSIRKIVLEEIEEHRNAVLKQISQITKERPWVSITVKTKQAIRTTLNAMNEAIKELKLSGYIDFQEYSKLLKSLAESNKVSRKMKIIQPSLPKVIFKEISWMAAETDLIEFLYKNVQKRSYDTADVICQLNKRSEGILIIVTGILCLKFIPEDVPNLQEMREDGALPIVDYLASVHFDEPFQDYAVSGSSIGELCFLTQRPYNSTIVADAPSVAYVLSHDVMIEAMEMYNDPIFGLEARLWKYASIDLTTRILMDTQVYQSSTQEQIKTHLERAFVPDISNFRTLAIIDLMEDVVLLEGLAADYHTKDIYVGPCYIHRSVQQLMFYKSSTVQIEPHILPKVIIIPIKDAEEYDIMERVENMNDLVNTANYMYSQDHSSRRQSNRKRRVLTTKKNSNKSVSVTSDQTGTSSEHSDKKSH